MGFGDQSVIVSYEYFGPTALRRRRMHLRVLAIAMVLTTGCFLILNIVNAQTRRPKRRAKPAITRPASTGSPTKYSAFLHSSEKHKSLACNACHKIPTAWTAKRDFPDVADFPDHDACVRCHRQQFFTRQAFGGTGPAVFTVCHVRAAPREDSRFAFGKPNSAEQPTKTKEEWQFTPEFPHDKHQNAIATYRPTDPSAGRSYPLANARRAALQLRLVRAMFSQPLTPDDKKPDYNNCSICHVTNRSVVSTTPPGWVDSFIPTAGTFKTMPHTHNACFNCHWKNEKPASDDCAGCHKSAAAFAPVNLPKRISAKFNHEGGKGEHVMECTTCHINITRASTLRGLTPDVPIAACARCHKDNKKTTYPKLVTIEEEFDQYKKTGECTYCHTSEVGKKKPPPSHDAVAQ